MLNDLMGLLGPDLAHAPPAKLMLIALIGYILVLLVIAFGLVWLTISLHRTNQRKAREWQQREKIWEPLLSKALIGDMTVAQVHEQIGENEGLFFVDFLTRYALRLAGSSRQVLEALAAPWLPVLAKKVVDGDDEQRARAVFTLSTLAPDPYRIVIASALDDSVPLVSMLAARSLAENHASEYIDLLIARMDKFHAWSPNYLTSMLVEIGRPNPPVLHQALDGKSHPVWIQTVVLRALSELNDLMAIPLSVRLLQVQQTDPELQAAALDLLGRLGYGEHKELVRQKCRDSNFVIRLHAVKALVRLGERQDAPLLKQMLEDDSQWIAFQSAQGLKQIEAIDVLEALAESHHPRSELAQQVLYDLDSDKVLLASAQSPGFAKRVPPWIRSAMRRQSAVAWQRVQSVLFHPETHPHVRMAIAASLGPEAAPMVQHNINRMLEMRQDPEPSYLYRAFYQLNPMASLETLRQHFFLTPGEKAKLEIMELLLQHHTPTTQQFVKELRQRLESSVVLYSNEFDQVLNQRLNAFAAVAG